jgi:hypothetical protein
MTKIQTARAQADALDRLYLETRPQRVVGIRQLHDWRVVGPALLCRCAGILRSVSVLLGSGREFDAQALARVLYEHVVTFSWLAADPQVNVLRWLKADVTQRRKWHDDMVARELIPADEPRGYSGFEQRYGDADVGGLPNAADMAAQADAHWRDDANAGADVARLFQRKNRNLRGHYALFYRHFSASMHAAVRGLIPVVIGGGNEPSETAEVEFNLEIDPRPAPDETGATVAPLVFAIALAVNSVAFGWPLFSDVDRVFSDHPPA